MEPGTMATGGVWLLRGAEVAARLRMMLRADAGRRLVWRDWHAVTGGMRSVSCRWHAMAERACKRRAMSLPNCEAPTELAKHCVAFGVPTHSCNSTPLTVRTAAPTKT